MSTNISQYRAAIGGYYSSSYLLSTLRLSFVDSDNILSFLILFYEGKKGLPLALLVFLLHINLARSTRVPKQHEKMNTYSVINQGIFVSKSMINNLVINFVLIMLLLACGDIHPLPGPDQQISIVHNNIRSLQKKAIYVEAELKNFDIITLSETWLYSNFPEDKIVINGFQKPYRQDRSDNSGWGGVAIYVKNNIYSKRRPDLEVNDLEAVWIETRIKKETLLVGCFYRPPNSLVSYWDKIDESISKAGNTDYKFVILGDFNTNPTYHNFTHLERIMYLNGLHQIINETTRYTDNTESIVDLILTPCPDLVSLSGVLPPVNSDHCCPFLEIGNVKVNYNPIKRTLLNYSKINSTEFDEKLSQIDWNEIINMLDLDEAASEFSNKLLDTAKLCMPVKTVIIRECDAPWMTEGIRKLIRKKIKIHTLAKRLNTVWSWNLFRKIRNELTSLIRTRKEEYVHEIENRINDRTNFGSKDWWKFVNQFARNKGIDNSDIPPLNHNNSIFYTSKEKASIFNSEFIKLSEISQPDDEVHFLEIKENVITPLTITPELVTATIKNWIQTKLQVQI